jgi:hypothetical protein
MTSTAAMSSTMASAARKTLSPLGALGATIASAPSANAMSVAIAIAQPRDSGPGPITSRKTEAGTTTPPIAATIGSAACRIEESSPARNSRLISSPTSRKNSDINPSLIHWCSVSDRTCSPEPTLIVVAHSAW